MRETYRASSHNPFVWNEVDALLVQIAMPNTALNTKLKMKLSRASLYMARFLNPTAFRPSDNLDHG